MARRQFHAHVPSPTFTRQVRVSHKHSMPSIATKMNANAQRLADSWVGAVSRLYALGHLNQCVNDILDKKQQSLDFLVSSLPAFDASTPTVLDLQVAREFTNWRPSICYALGVEDNLFLDFYWEVRPTFDENVFIETFKKLTNASVAHTNLPACY